MDDVLPIIGLPKSLVILLRTIVCKNSVKNWKIYSDYTSNICVNIKFTDIDSSALSEPVSYRRVGIKQARRNATRAATYRHHKLKADHAEIISIHTDKKRKIEDSPEAVRDMTVNFRDMLSVDSPDSLHTDSVHTGFISPEAIKWVKQQPNIGTGKPECLELPCTLSEHDTEYVSVHEHHQEYDLPFPAHRHEEYDLPSPAHHHEEYDLPSPIQSPPGSPPASTQVYPDHNLILKHDIGQPETDDETNPKQTLSVSVSDNSDNTIMACPCCDAI